MTNSIDCPAHLRHNVWLCRICQMTKAQIILLTIAVIAVVAALSCGQTYAERANNDDSLPGRYRFVSFTELTGAIIYDADVNTSSIGRNAGNTPLHNASGTADEDVIMALLRNGAHVNAANNLGSTPLHAAATTGDRESILALLTNGANPNARNIEGLTPLQSLYKWSSRNAWSSHHVRYYEDLANFLWTMSR